MGRPAPRLTRLVGALVRPILGTLLGPRREDTRSLGRSGERAAARHLRRAGYRVLARNARTPIGEVDLIAEAPDRRTIVFVEVKTRAGTGAAGERRAEAAITAAKRRKLAALAEHLRRANGWLDRPARIDVVAADRRPGGRGFETRHYEAAVGR